MPWRFEQTRKTPTDIIGRVWCDQRWDDVRVPINQPQPQHRRGLTYWRSDQAVHCSPSRTSDGSAVCPEFARFRKRLSFSRAV